ncbi:MAG: molybdenum cofactor guanylyltransferase [Fimbriimonadaceae bacterium]
MSVEAVVLTGGQSRRMGKDKASILIKGEAMHVRLVRMLETAGFPTTVLGPQGVADLEPDSGPLRALAAFRPDHDWVFVCSCDLPLFDPAVVGVLRAQADGYDAVVPSLEGRLQPLAALYSNVAFDIARGFDAGEGRMMEWVRALKVCEVTDEDLAASGLQPGSVASANTPEEWQALRTKGGL